MLTEVNYKMYKQKRTKSLITTETVLQCRILTAREDIINIYEAKAKVQTTTKYNVMHMPEQVPKSVVQKQSKGKSNKSKNAY